MKKKLSLINKMQLYIISVLSLVVSILLFGLFYLYKQFNLLLVKVNQLTYDLNNLQSENNSPNDLKNIFENTDLMNSFLNSNNDEIINDDDEELDDNGSDDGENELDDEESDDGEIELDDEESDDGEIELSDDEQSDNEDVFGLNSETKNEGLVDLTNTDLNVKIIESKSSPSSKRTVPNELAKNFDVGHKVVSENDSNTYEVIANKNGVKRWKKIKND
tara:strand:- start:1127 stop:1783 length:657 start_codon:yes stop_codon:yes gene_type:complete